MSNNRGQSLIELVVALGLLTVIITILSVTTITGLRNSQFSKNQSQATKLGQDGLEKLRAIRDRNYTVCGPGENIKAWNSIYDTNCPTTPLTCKYTLKTLPVGACVTPPSEIWLSNNTNPPEEIVAEGVTFTRTITITDYKNDINQKEVNVKVSWTDLSGDHNSNLSTIMAKL